MANKTRAGILVVFVILPLFFSGCTFLPIGKAWKRAAAQKNRPQASEPTSEEEQRRIRDSQQAYATLRANPKALPQIPDNNGEAREYAAEVYSGIFYEALINRDFDLIDRAADEARESKEQTLAGVWKLERIYDGLEHPRDKTSDAEWKRHSRLLREWMEKEPDSETAPVAVAASMFKFGWNARGHGYADSVSSESSKLFAERVALARNLLTSITARTSCPMWYSLMLQIALSENWDREAYEELWEHAVQFEPTWYEYYRQKAIYLLPKWHGEPGDLDAYANSYATRPGDDNARIYFLIIQCASATDQSERQKPLAHYDVFKQGFSEMRKAHGVTRRTQGIAFEKAMLARDSAFAQEVMADINAKPDDVARN
jgi:hypothetical protein